jgi:hypothetical protein
MLEFPELKGGDSGEFAVMGGLNSSIVFPSSDDSYTAFWPPKTSRVGSIALTLNGVANCQIGAAEPPIGVKVGNEDDWRTLLAL